MTMHLEGELVQTSDSDGQVRTPRTGAPGRSTLTGRMPASAASIARAVVAQLKADPSAVQARGDLDGPDVHAVAAQGTSGTGSPLPHLDQIQRAFGHHDVSGVRAHVGGAAAEASASLGALAYAAGDDVAFASAPDLHLAAHEAAHVVQQRAGVRLAGGIGAAGDDYERHADEVADAVCRGEFVEELLGGKAHRGPAGGPAVQRQPRRPGARDQGGGDSDQRQAPANDDPAGSAGGNSPRSRIVRRPDATELLQRFRESVQSIANDQGVPFPTRSWNAFVDQVQQLARRERPAGLLRDESEQAEAAVLAYTWRLSGSLMVGEPQQGSERVHRGTGTTNRGNTDTAEGTNTQSEGEQETESAGAEYEGVEAAGESQRSRGREQVARDENARTQGTSMELPMEDIQWTSEVSARFTVDLTHIPARGIPWFGEDTSNNLLGPTAELFGADAVAPRTGTVQGVIGQINDGQQQSAPNEPEAPARPRRRRPRPRRQEQEPPQPQPARPQQQCE